VQQLVAAHGSDIWWTAPIEQLLPPSLVHLAPKLRKGEDTMDVWFDSGSSWAGVVQAGADRGLGFPADLYLEGSDQHRGEFWTNTDRYRYRLQNLVAEGVGTGALGGGLEGRGCSWRCMGGARRGEGAQANTGGWDRAATTRGVRQGGGWGAGTGVCEECRAQQPPVLWF
jgi:hypothetical protein